MATERRKTLSSKPPAEERRKVSRETETVDVAVRIGFAPEAEKQFRALNNKERTGILRKIKDVIITPGLAKPLTGKLAGCCRVTYGRLRCVVRLAEGAAICLVVAPRKDGSADDPYARAVGYLISGGDEAEHLLAAHVRAFLEENAAHLRKSSS